MASRRAVIAEIRRSWGAAAGLWALHPNHTFVTLELVAQAHAAGLRVNAWTANEPTDIAALMAAGVDGICSDFPERVPKS